MATIATTISLKDLISSKLQTINNNINNSVNEFKKLKNSLTEINSGLELLGKFKGMLGGVANSVQGLVGEYQHQLEMETRLNTVMGARFGATQQMQEEMKKTLQAQADMTGYSYETLTNGAQELATYITDMKTLQGLMPVLANMAKQGGVNSEQGMMSYATMLGKVMGGDMGGMSKRGYVFSDEEKAAFKLMNEQQRLKFITEQVTNAIGNQANAINSLTPDSLQSVAKSYDLLRKDAGKALEPLIKFYTLVSTQWKIAFLQPIVDALNFVYKHFESFIIMLGAVGVAVLALAALFIVLKAQAIGAAIAAAAAWVTAAAPIALIIAIILAIIGALALFLVYSEKTFKAVGIAIGAVAATFVNFFKIIVNSAEWVAEMIINAFMKIEKPVLNVYLSIMQGIVALIKPIAGLLGKLFGQDWGKSLTNFQNKLQEIKNAKPPEVKFKRQELVSYKDYMNKGGQIGSNLSKGMQDGLSNYTKNIKSKLKGALPSSSSQTQNNEQLKFDGNGNLLVSDKNTLNLAKEYKDLLSKRASEKFFIRQSNVTPSVSITMNNSESKPEDVRKVVVSAIEKITKEMGGLF